MTFTEQFLAEAAEILKQIDVAAVERLAATLAACRAGGGRLFILGVGGSAANASHAVNDFRKICGLEAYAPTDNVSELTRSQPSKTPAQPSSLVRAVSSLTLSVGA